jgi:hypothetical protein
MKFEDSNENVFEGVGEQSQAPRLVTTKSMEVVNSTKRQHIDQTLVPKHIIHKNTMVYVNGLFLQPGKDNDYTIVYNENSDFVKIKWSRHVLPSDLICFFHPTTGKRWSWSFECGTYVDIE